MSKKWTEGYTKGMLDRKDEHGKEGERKRNTTRGTGMPVKWKD
jgi:hypothetical protein